MSHASFTAHGLELAALLLLALIAVMLYARLASQAQRLADSREQLHLILDNMTEGIVVLDHSRNIVLMNRRASGMISVSAAGQSYDKVEDRYDAYSPEGELIPRDQWPSARALRGDFVQRFIIGYRDKITGEMGSREISTAPVPQRPGKPAKVILSYRDDTERRRADEARSRLAAIVESSDDAIISKNTNGIITSWNKGAETIFGYTAAEILGQSIRRLLPADRQTEEDDILQRILAGETVEHFSTTRLTKDNRTIHVSLTISPIRDAAGHIIGASKIARDITGTRSLEHQLRQSQKMEAIGQLTGGIAHDFNNLLGIVIGNLDLLEQDLKSRIVAENLTLTRTQTAQKAALRGAKLTKRLLAFSCNEQLNPAPLNLAHAIRNTLELATRALGPEIVVSTDLDTTLPPVFVDPSGLEGALLNLFVNARDAMPNGGSLRITSKICHRYENAATMDSATLKPGPYACISVSDNGEGMPQHVLDRAFEPFFTTKGVGRGTGLGLAMVYGFLKQSNGTARIYSEPGYGTTVTLYLPFAEQSAQQQEDASPAEHAAQAGGTILLVDDEADLLALAAIYVEKLGYTALQAKDAPTALQIVEQGSPIDIMVTDIIMPGGMNGVELAQKVAQIRPSTRVIYTSGFPADALAQKNLQLEGGIHLHKPYRLADLGAAIRKAMESHTPASSINA